MSYVSKYAQGGSTNSSLFILFINRLEGWKTKCKALHWGSPKGANNIHVRLDELLGVIGDYQDTVAEGIMGVTQSHINQKQIAGTPSEAEDPREFIEEIKSYTISFYSKIPENPLYAGLRSECETFIQAINKYDYLFSLCEDEW